MPVQARTKLGGGHKRKISEISLLMGRGVWVLCLHYVTTKMGTGGILGKTELLR